MRKTINISMPEAMHKFVEARSRRSSYGSTSEYIRELIRRDQNLVQRELRAVRPEPYDRPPFDPLDPRSRRY